MEKETNISGISENLAESIIEQKAAEKPQSQNTFLHGKRIAISVSLSEELEYLGLSKHHLDDISIEIARYLIVNGATMLYGGDLRIGGFVRLFSELSYQYKSLSDKQSRFVNYFPFPISRKVSIDERATFVKQQVEPRILEIPRHLGEVDKNREYNPSASIVDRYICSECFTDMRITMAKESNARILIGGKQRNYLGYIPGIIEEAYHTLKANRPVYLLGGFGGATKSLIDIIEKHDVNELTNEFQYDSDFLKEFRNYSQDKSTISLNYDEIAAFFQQYTIDTIAEQNGLSKEENMILFESTNIHELVFLIIKGLQKTGKV